MIDWQDLTGLTRNKQSSWFWIITFSSYLSIFSLVASNCVACVQSGTGHTSQKADRQVTILSCGSNWSIFRIENLLHSTPHTSALQFQLNIITTAVHCTVKPQQSQHIHHLGPICSLTMCVMTLCMYLEHKIILELSKTKTVGERKN